MEKDHDLKKEAGQPDMSEDEGVGETPRERWEKMRSGHEFEGMAVDSIEKPPVEISPKDLSEVEDDSFLKRPDPNALEVEEDSFLKKPDPNALEDEDDFPLEMPETTTPKDEDGFLAEAPLDLSEDLKENTGSIEVFNKMPEYEKEFKENIDDPEKKKSILAEIGEKVRSAIEEIDKEEELEEKLKNNSLSAREIADNYDFLQTKGFSITPKELLDKYEAEEKEK